MSKSVEPKPQHNYADDGWCKNKGCDWHCSMGDEPACPWPLPIKPEAKSIKATMDFKSDGDTVHRYDLGAKSDHKHTNDWVAEGRLHCPICGANPELAKSDHQHKFVKSDVGMPGNLGTPVRYECSCGKARIELEEDQPTKSDIQNEIAKILIDAGLTRLSGKYDSKPTLQRLEALVAEAVADARTDEAMNCGAHLIRAEREAYRTAYNLVRNQPPGSIKAMLKELAEEGADK